MPIRHLQELLHAPHFRLAASTVEDGTGSGGLFTLSQNSRLSTNQSARRLHHSRLTSGPSFRAPLSLYLECLAPSQLTTPSFELGQSFSITLDIYTLHEYRCTLEANAIVRVFTCCLLLPPFQKSSVALNRTCCYTRSSTILETSHAIQLFTSI